MKNSNTVYDDRKDNLSPNSSIKPASNAVRARDSRHPAILQLLALGYEVGDRVCGRNISPEELKSFENRTVDWTGILTEDNIIITPLVWDTGKIIEGDEEFTDGLDWLDEQNETRQIYYHVNGGRKNTEVDRWYAVFFEEDTGTHAEQQAKIDAIPIKPTIQVRTRKSNHTYFVVYADESESLEAWAQLQERTAYVMGSDPSLKDKPRLMRLAGFDHVKVIDGRIDCVKCDLRQCDDSRVYSVEEVIQALDDYASDNGIKTFSPKRFDGYQYVTRQLSI